MTVSAPVFRAFTVAQSSAIANLEEWAKANGWKRVESAHIKGRQLCVEFRGKQAAGRPNLGAM